MGSIILACPLIEQARKELPHAEIFFLSFNKNRPAIEVLNILPYKNILTIRDESFFLFITDTFKIIFRLRKEKIDIAFDLELFSRFTALLTYFSGATKKVGFYRYSMEGLYRGNFLTHRVQYNPLLHISKSYLSLWLAVRTETKLIPKLEEMIEDRKISFSKFVASKEAKGRIWDRLKKLGIKQGYRLILLNPGDGNIHLREWPLEHFITLVKRILEESKNYIIIIGTKEASQKAAVICKLADNERCLDLTNKTTISDVLSLCDIANALITNDSGLAHLASLTSVKKFIFFGPESPRIYSPIGDNTWTIYSHLPCSPCFSAFNHRKSACDDNQCLKTIKPDEVHRLIKENL